MHTTKNLGLQIPDQDDIYDVDYVGYNMEILDGIMDLDGIERAFNRIFFWHVPYSDIIEETFRSVYMHTPERIVQDAGLTPGDYGTEITSEEIRDMICAGWDGEDASYYDSCAEIAEEQYHIVFGGIPNISDVPDNAAMTVDDILEAISMPWDGQTSPYPAAMSASEITEAVNTPWDGQASPYPAAMSTDEIVEAIKNTVLQ